MMFIECIVRPPDISDIILLTPMNINLAAFDIFALLLLSQNIHQSQNLELEKSPSVSFSNGTVDRHA